MVNQVPIICLMRIVVIFKPVTEEIDAACNALYGNSKRVDQGVVVCGGAFREVHAYVLDKSSGFAYMRVDLRI